MKSTPKPLLKHLATLATECQTQPYFPDDDSMRKGYYFAITELIKMAKEGEISEVSNAPPK